VVARGKPIYVEIVIRATLAEVWRHTQIPALHERWDLRFTDIDYLPRPDESQPQHFTYVTRIGFGFAIRGEGSSVGQRDSSEGSTSALQFWSDDRKSLIRAGSGYWKYVPVEGGIRFLTLYGYTTRFGAAGRWFDALVFRPLMGWATAWSFDRLRLWVEQGIDPTDSMSRSIVYAVARVTLAAIWIYQGLVPKLLYPDSGEFDILRSLGLFVGWERRILTIVGLLEIAFGFLLLICWHRTRLLLLNVLALVVLAIGAVVSQPSIFTEPFNPSTLTLAMVALSVAGLLSYRDLPSARNYLRRDPGNEV
jgi:hypothetical protein